MGWKIPPPTLYAKYLKLESCDFIEDRVNISKTKNDFMK